MTIVMNSISSATSTVLHGAGWIEVLTIPVLPQFLPKKSPQAATSLQHGKNSNDIEFV